MRMYVSLRVCVNTNDYMCFVDVCSDVIKIDKVLGEREARGGRCGGEPSLSVQDTLQRNDLGKSLDETMNLTSWSEAAVAFLSLANCEWTSYWIVSDTCLKSALIVALMSNCLTETDTIIYVCKWMLLLNSSQQPKWNDKQVGWDY